MLLRHLLTLMPRGGWREGSGGKPTWKHGKTKPVRVPIALADRILEIARIIDDEGDLSNNSKVIDLAGVAILQSKHGPIVRLEDLLRVGYRIKPERLVRGLRLRSSSREESDVEHLLERALEDYEQ